MGKEIETAAPASKTRQLLCKVPQITIFFGIIKVFCTVLRRLRAVKPSAASCQSALEASIAAMQ